MIPEIIEVNKDGLVKLSFCDKYHMLGSVEQRLKYNYSYKRYRKIVCKHTGYKGSENIIYYSINQDIDLANLNNIFNFKPFLIKNKFLVPTYLCLTFDKFKIKGHLESNNINLINVDQSSLIKVYKRRISGSRAKVLKQLNQHFLLSEILNSDNLSDAASKIEKYLLLI